MRKSESEVQVFKAKRINRCPEKHGFFIENKFVILHKEQIQWLRKYIHYSVPGWHG